MQQVDPVDASPNQRHVVDVGGDEVAPSSDNSHWIEQNNRARLLLDEGRLAEAVELFAGCHDAVPEDDVFRRNLAEALFRLANRTHEAAELEAAILRLERAVEVAPERDELARLLDRWRKELKLAEGDTFSPGNYFRVEYDGERGDLLKHNQEVLDFLEGGGSYRVGAYETLRGFFGVDPVIESGERIRVVLYDREEFDALTGLGDWAGGVFDGVIRVAVDDLSSERTRWERILRHELVHAFVREVGGRKVPGWLNEGLAQLLEEDRPNVSLARAEIKGTPLFPLERLQESLATWTDVQEIQRAYAESLVFVDFLKRETAVDLTKLLRACREGEAVDGAYKVDGVPLSTYLSDLELDLAGR